MCSKHLTEALSNSTTGSHLLIPVILFWFYSCSHSNCPNQNLLLASFHERICSTHGSGERRARPHVLFRKVGEPGGLVTPRVSVCLDKSGNQETQTALNKDNSYKRLNHLVGRQSVIQGSPALPEPHYSQKLQPPKKGKPQSLLLMPWGVMQICSECFQGRQGRGYNTTHSERLSLKLFWNLSLFFQAPY